MLSGGDNACTTFGGSTSLKFGRAKIIKNLVKFRTTFDFDLSLEWIEMSTSCGKWRYQASSLVHSTKKSVNFGPLRTMVSTRMLTDPKLTMCVLCMLMYLSSSHVTLL